MPARQGATFSAALALGYLQAECISKINIYQKLQQTEASQNSARPRPT